MRKITGQPRSQGLPKGDGNEDRLLLLLLLLLHQCGMYLDLNSKVK